MRWEELEKKEEAPESGYILAYTRQKVIFEPYKNELDLEKYLGEPELLEVHLFDKDKEYRAISSESKRFNKHFVEHVAKFDCTDSSKIFCEKVFLEDQWKNKELIVFNHVAYDDNGMAAIDDYRLLVSEMGENHE